MTGLQTQPKQGDGSAGLLDHPFEHYSHGEDRPLGSYGVFVGLFNAAFAAALLANKRAGRDLPNRIDARDLALLAIGTHKLSRLLAKDWVTSFLRAPFTRYEGSDRPGEVNEQPVGRGMRLAMGELLTCPYCLGQWVAAGFSLGFVAQPRLARLVASTFAIVAASDFLHIAYQAAHDRAKAIGNQQQ